MKIEHKEAQDEGRFFIQDNDDVVAQIVYINSGDNTLVIEHTEVAKALRGNQVGFELVQRTVEFARENGMKVSPLCPFAKAVFERQPDFCDVLA